jgi:hypothetical protein
MAAERVALRPPERLRPVLEQKADWYAVLTDPRMPVTSTLWD